MNRSAMQLGIRRLRQQLAVPHAANDSDEELLQAFLHQRDEAAFTVMVRRHGPMVLHVCRRVLGHQQDAEDAFQATFLVLARNAASLRDKTALASWLHGTAYRIAMKAKQSAARRRKYEAQTPIRSSADPSEELRWREVRTLLDDEIARLPERYRRVFVLCCLENLSQAEAGKRLGLKERTVSNRLEAARQRLSQSLARRGVELTAVLGATTLATPSVSALPAGLLASTLQAVLATAGGGGLAGVVSASVAELVQSASVAMMMSKAKIAAMVLLTMAMLAGASVWTYRGVAVNALPSSTQPVEPLGAKNDENKAASPKRETAKTVEIKGRVLDPDGKPKAGAKLFMPRAKATFGTDIVMKRVGETDADGRFHLTLDRPSKDVEPYLVAHANGLGVDWINLSDRRRSGEVILRLSKDVSIRGRIVNTEGRPVTGVSVSITAIFVPANEKLDDYLAGLISNWRDNLSTPLRRLVAALDAVTGVATTDRDGRFALHGAGGERIVFVKVSGGGIARETLYIITRPGFDAAPYNAVLRRAASKRLLGLSPFRSLDPPSFTYVAQPGKTIEGTVKDAVSGKPIRCGVSFLDWSESIATVSDVDGKYRLEGVPKNAQGYDVSAWPTTDAAYLLREEHVADTAGFAKVQFDLALVQGAVVRGRVIDKQTGKGVQCGIRFAPLADNKFFGSKPGFDNYRTNRAMDETDKEGRFRLFTIPGKALVLAQVHEGETFNGQHLCAYRVAVPDRDHKDMFKPTGDGWTVATAGGVSEFIPGAENAVKVIDVKKDGETRVELFVDRGVTGRIAVQDAAGKPLAGAWAAGVTDHWPITYRLPEATATVYALNPDKPRTMAFYHPEKKLGGTATVRGDEKEAVVVKLAPMGKVSGRLIDTDSKPVEGMEVSIHPPGVSGSELYRFAAPSGKPTRTDKDGRFHIDGVVPNLKFWLNLRNERTFFVGDPRIGVKQVTPGEPLDLGDVRVKPQR